MKPIDRCKVCSFSRWLTTFSYSYFKDWETHLGPMMKFTCFPIGPILYRNDFEIELEANGEIIGLFNCWCNCIYSVIWVICFVFVLIANVHCIFITSVWIGKPFYIRTRTNSDDCGLTPDTMTTGPLNVFIWDFVLNVHASIWKLTTERLFQNSFIHLICIWCAHSCAQFYSVHDFEFI